MKEVFTLAEFVYRLVLRLPDFHDYVQEVQDIMPEYPGWSDWLVVFKAWLDVAYQREQAKYVEDTMETP